MVASWTRRPSSSIIKIYLSKGKPHESHNYPVIIHVVDGVNSAPVKSLAIKSKADEYHVDNHNHRNHNCDFTVHVGGDSLNEMRVKVIDPVNGHAAYSGEIGWDMGDSVYGFVSEASLIICQAE